MPLRTQSLASLGPSSPCQQRRKRFGKRARALADEGTNCTRLPRPVIPCVRAAVSQLRREFRLRHGVARLILAGVIGSGLGLIFSQDPRIPSAIANATPFRLI